MRILFVTPVVPSRAYGRRPYNFLRYLHGKHELHLATFLTDPGYDTPYLEELRSWGIEVSTVNRPKWNSIGNCLIAPLRRWPLRAMYVRSGRLRRLIRSLANKHQFDIVHLDRMRMGQYGIGLDAGKRVVDFTDSIPLYLERKRSFTRSLSARAVDWWERRTIPTFENLVLGHNQLGILCSQVDADHFLKMHPDAPIKTIVNMVDPEEWHPKEHSAGEARGVYTGTLSYEPNLDALQYLVDDILPQVWKELPRFRLLVYGTRPGKRAFSMVGDPRIEIIPNVPKLSEELSQRDIYVCPVRIGSGMRNKILEAMATEMAVVSTTIGCEGMGLKDGKQIAIADSAEEFANRMVHLARDQGERQLLGKTGREFVLQNHRPRLIGAQLEAAYGEILNQGKE